MAINRIDPTPVRLSTNLSIERQTPKNDFGNRVKAGLDTAAGAVANGAAVAAPFVPGGAIVSAAVSSVTQMSNGMSSGQQTAAASGYAMSGVVGVGGGGGGGINTTVGAGGGGGQMPGVGSTVGGGAPSVVQGTQGGGTLGQMNSDLVHAQQENGKLMQVQMAMQRENQVFTTVSNVLKTRHDTVKNTISNVR